jgi:5,10-methenyltetrahydromethanopterin hydrogenase
MSFNRRYVSAEILKNLFEREDSVVDNFVNASDSFIFLDNVASDAMNLWVEGKKEESRKKIKEHVLRITTEISGNN